MRRRYERRRAAKAAASAVPTPGTPSADGESVGVGSSASLGASDGGVSARATGGGGLVGGTGKKRQQTVHAAAQIKLHVHGHEFMGGEEIVLNPEAFPQLKEMVWKDYVVEVFHPMAASPDLSPLLSPAERAERLSEGSPRQHLLVEIPESSATPIKAKLQVSVLKETAALFQLAAFKDVTVRFLPKAQVEVDFVEISLKDHFMSRRDLWYLQKALAGSALHVGRSIRVQSARWQVMDIRCNGDKVRSGVVTDNTKFTFRSCTSRVMWLVQISPEMWDIANSGNLYLEVFLQVVKNVLNKWMKHKVSHSLTILFYARSYYPDMDKTYGVGRSGMTSRTTPAAKSKPAAGNNANSSNGSQTAGDETGSTFPYDRSDCFSIGVDEQGRHYQDFYKIVAFDSTITDVQPLLVKLKEEINAFPHLCGWRSPADMYVSSFSPADPFSSSGPTPKTPDAASTPWMDESTDPSASPPQRCGVPSNARDGNMLEAVNIVLNIFEKHHIDRHLSRSGQSVVLITAGNGIFSVNKRLSEITEQRMMDHGIGIDMISLASRPLHKCPLFLFKESDLSDMKLPPRNNGGDMNSGVADICLCNPTGNANFSSSHQLLQQQQHAGPKGAVGPRRSRTGSQEISSNALNEVALSMIMANADLGVSSAAAAARGSSTTHLCKYCIQRQETRKKYVVPLWIPICFVQESMLVSHKCPMDEDLFQFCAVCHPRVSKTKEFEPLPMCRMFRNDDDDDLTHFSHLSLPKPLECLLNGFEKPEDSSSPLSDDERDNFASATMISSTFDDFVLAGLDSDLVRARASSLLSSDDSVSYDGGSVVTKAHTFSSISQQQMAQEFEQYDDQVFAVAVASRPRVATKMSENEFSGYRMAMTPPLRPANPLMGSVFKKRGASGVFVGTHAGSGGNAPATFNEHGSNNSGGGAGGSSRWRQLEHRNISPLNVDQGYVDAQVSTSEEPRQSANSLPNTFQLEGSTGVVGQLGYAPPYTSSPVLKPTDGGAVAAKGDIFHSQEFILKQLTSNQRRWSQVRPSQDYRYKLVQNVLKWRSLCFPALLPLTSDYIPGPKELKAHYTESFYSVMLPERDENNGIVFRDYRELVMEMVAQRFSQDFQLVTTEDADGGAADQANATVFRLSMGHRIHEIVYNEETQTIDVKRYLQKVTSRSDVDIMEYRYALWSPVTDGFLSVSQEFRKYPQVEYQWNHLDQLICGYTGDMSEGTRYKRLLYCLIPPQLNGLSPETCKTTLETYTERCRKFLDYLKSRADVSTGFPDVKLSTEWRPDLPTSGAGAFKRVGHRSVKMLAQWAAEATQSVTSQNWLIAKVDTELLATQCYHVEVQWLACMGSLVDEAITGSARRAKQLGLEFMQVSENGISSNLDLHPFIAPIFIPVADPYEQQQVERALTERFGFCCEGLHPIPFTHLNHKREYAVATPEQNGNGAGSGPRRLTRRVVTYYRQYAHRSLSCFARMTLTGLVWISNQKTHQDEIQPVFEQLKRYIEAVRAANSGLGVIIGAAVDLALKNEAASPPKSSQANGVKLSTNGHDQQQTRNSVTSSVAVSASTPDTVVAPPAIAATKAPDAGGNVHDLASTGASSGGSEDEKENELRALNIHESSSVAASSTPKATTRAGTVPTAMFNQKVASETAAACDGDHTMTVGEGERACEEGGSGRHTEEAEAPVVAGPLAAGPPPGSITLPIVGTPETTMLGRQQRLW